MSSNRFNDFIRRAQGAISTFRNGGNNFFIGKSGEIIYSKNNVCLHEDEENNLELLHTPGYLSIYCLDDEHLGVTLVLQWMPNTLLEKNPTSIRSVSPKPLSLSESNTNIDNKNIITRLSCSNREIGDSEEELSTIEEKVSLEEHFLDSNASTVPLVEEEVKLGQRPITLLQSEGQMLFLPSINLIPNTPIEQESDGKFAEDRLTESSSVTSGEDEIVEEEEEDDNFDSSSDDKSGKDTKELDLHSSEPFCQNFATSLIFDSIPEHFARDHNLTWMKEENNEEFSTSKKEEEQKNGEQKLTNKRIASLFSGKMRSMRVFYSNFERTSGQLVIASHDSQYKIFHFHHDGLDKLAIIFERWNAVKAKSAGNDSPSVSGPDRHLLICPVGSDLAKAEMDPEDGLYERLNWEHWKSFLSNEGIIGDSFTVRKKIYFASMDPKLRKELWPFLLKVFPWSSNYEQRDAIRNNLFLKYQQIKRYRIKKIAKALATGEKFYINVESSILKDVLRTDRRNSFFAGDGNANLEIMKSILLTYAVKFPEINYIQGMSDLLSPLLFTLRDEPLAYWCFVELMKFSLFCQSEQRKSVMEIQLDYLRELIRIFIPEFYTHLMFLGGDAPSLMFVHRWILLFFKREFPQNEALHIWEACWSRYRTTHFHLFVACAIVSVFGPDVVSQRLPNDEILLYFSSLAMHMDARLILRKARGLLYQFYRMQRIPCTLAGLHIMEENETNQWSSHIPLQKEIFCNEMHGSEPCPIKFLKEEEDEQYSNI
ncbi:Rab-GAP TBC domain-containing protein [Meloidogyne graminicola]|uniref:Rab-GAP TBC domain-containing protein n=1 Tax=Meloidogyne graminicola TaxID=189291 RepID=A0A8S9ZQK5_9BILA|nr:Rab-GAP TBC domain-containing protein [Meloidogyne graminicola]